jgi:hypothetical protein
LPPEIRSRILDYCRAGLAGSTYPASRFYPDLGPAAMGDGAGGTLLSAA